MQLNLLEAYCKYRLVQYEISPKVLPDNSVDTCGVYPHTPNPPYKGTTELNETFNNTIVRQKNWIMKIQSGIT